MFFGPMAVIHLANASVLSGVMLITLDIMLTLKLVYDAMK